MLADLKEQLAEVEAEFVALRKRVEGCKAVPHMIASRLAVALDKIMSTLQKHHEAVASNGTK